MTSSCDQLVFAPLGGVGEIGMNLALYGLGDERRRNWIAVDFGVSFATEEYLPGVELIFPDIRYLVEERKNLAGIVLTHAHEDHFGALMDLWPRLQVPVYATPFTAALLEAKRVGEPGTPEIPVKVVPLNARFKLGAFDLEYVSVAHSIPESNALVIRTPLGTVLHTGDWKLDPTPVIGPPTDEAKLRALGDEGVLALVGDSTNAIREGRSPSEVEVAGVLAQLVASAPGRVAITTFASHVARIRAAAEAARAAGREVVVVGRAMERVVQVARETGYLDGIQEFHGTDAYLSLPRNRVLALCTGSQGERRAALARIADAEHPTVTLDAGDRVIFSSRPIPGNEKAIAHVINGLVRQGIEVITERTHLVHVSGHPRRDEMRELYGWVRPRLIVPVHGEPLHLAEHAALARAMGIEVVRCENGDLVRLAPGPAAVIDEIPAARLYKDGRLVIEAEGPTVLERRRLAFAGIVSVALALTKRGEVAAGPEIRLTGIPETTADGVRLEDIAYEAVMRTIDSVPRARRHDPDALSESLRRAVRAAIAEHWGKKPVCHVQVLAIG
jgi:ribonuclease J